jgi:translocation and assembly module TamA
LNSISHSFLAFCWILGTCLVASVPAQALPYTATIEGVVDASLREAMENASLTIVPAEKNVPSFNALRLRANDDASRLTNVAVYYGYFDCHVTPTIKDGPMPQVTFEVQLGSRFVFKTITLTWSDEDMVRADLEHRTSEQLPHIKGPNPKDIPSIRTNQPATGKAIASADADLTKALRSRGFAFTKVVSKQVFVDRASGLVDVAIDVQTGPIVRFGQTTIIGATDVKPVVFTVNQEWKAGDIYSPVLIEKTETALQRSGLFQSVQIEEARDLGENWTLPVTIYVTEAKQRTVGAGVCYTTTYGAGVTAEWEHRNIQGKGRKLSADLELWQKMRIASLSYTIPHFKRLDENLIWILEYDHQTYLPFTSSAINGSALVDCQWTPKTDFVYGIRLERLESTGIIGHQHYHLFKVPLQLTWSNANSPLDPTKGTSVNIHLTPSYQFRPPHYHYLIHTTSLAAYTSIAENTITFAARLGLGDIFSSSGRSIPLPDRFFGGSQNSLRGYKTGSVSPLNHQRKPVGGRSIATGSFELRTRAKALGWVAFYDVGAVYREIVPRIAHHPLLQSVGIGLRYTTPIGPLRLDIAFPLQRRKGIDPWGQIYFSIGQAF